MEVKSMICENSHADSDSVNLGSNPGPPAIEIVDELAKKPGRKRRKTRKNTAQYSAHKSAQKPNLIYFIRCREFVKIGYSWNPASRFANIQVTSPLDMELAAVAYGGEREEELLHIAFRHLHVRGEWFRCDGSLADLLIILDGLSAADAAAAMGKWYKRTFGKNWLSPAYALAYAR